MHASQHSNPLLLNKNIDTDDTEYAQCTSNIASLSLYVAQTCALFCVTEASAEYMSTRKIVKWLMKFYIFCILYFYILHDFYIFFCLVG